VEPRPVVFLYRGAATDAGIAGDMNGDRREDPMWRVPGTDLFWYEATLEPDARVNYHFVRDFEERLPDPRNPWQVPGHAVRHVLGPMPAEQSSSPCPAVARFSGKAEASRRGRLEEHVVASSSRPGATVTLKAYVPAGYDQGQERLPLALHMDGDAALEMGLVARSLDNLIPQRVAPVIVAFVGRPAWGEKPPSDEEGVEALAELLAKDVLGFLDGRYRTDPVRERRAVIGTSLGAYNAAMLVSRRPAVFGALGMQSIVMLDTDDLLLRKQVPTSADAPLRVYLDWGKYDRRATREACDMGGANARFAAFLRARLSPAGGEAPEGSGWAGWRNRTDRVFGTLFPPRPRPASAELASR
jgi:enterochelin esterase-like enzyme